jgi:hypothetical protein
MAKRKRTNDDLENTTWKTKDRATVNQGHGMVAIVRLSK